MKIESMRTRSCRSFKIDDADLPAEARERLSAIRRDEVMCAVLVDRLLHHCYNVNSCRMKHHQELRRSMQRSEVGDGPAPAASCRRGSPAR